MSERRDIDEPTAVGVGDGSLAGPGIGGSLLGPEAGVIRDPVGDEIAAPLAIDPGEPTTQGEPADDARVLRDVDPSTDASDS